MLGPRRRTDQVIDASMRPESSADDHWVTGDHFGLPIPADPAALRAGGAAFLTRAFHVSGALTAGNAVTGISRFQEVPGGSTGRKLLLRVEYDKPVASTHTDLFVKFSRDFDDPIRDRGKTQMESEILFASLSRANPGFRSRCRPPNSPTSPNSSSDASEHGNRDPLQHDQGGQLFQGIHRCLARMAVTSSLHDLIMVHANH